MALRPPQGPSLIVTWVSVFQLATSGVTAEMVGVGKRLTITGSPAIDPERREITLIRKVEDAVNSWRWEGGQVFRSHTRDGQDATR